MKGIKHNWICYKRKSNQQLRGQRDERGHEA